MIDRVTSSNPNRRLRGRRHPLVVATAAAGLFLAACLPQVGEFDGDEETTDVRVIGDSLVYIAEQGPGLENPDIHRLSDELAAQGDDPDVVAEIGAVTGDLSSLSVTPANLAEISVIALGTNDRSTAYEGSFGQPKVSLVDAAANLDTYLDRADSDCEVLVGIAETEPWGLDETGPEWNEYLEQQAAQSGGVFIDWAAVVAEHPEYVGAADGVHQTEEGQIAYRAAIVDAVNECKEIIENAATTTTTSTIVDETTTTVEDTTTTTESEPTTTTTTTTTTTEETIPE